MLDIFFFQPNICHIWFDENMCNLLETLESHVLKSLYTYLDYDTYFLVSGTTLMCVSGLRATVTSSSSSSSSKSTNRIGNQCSMDDIVLHQDATPPLPSGIPTYTVNVQNLCPLKDGCAMGQIHLSCGKFSSARQINPSIFRRLSINDCLLNDGRPLRPGETISFQYANSFSYPMAVSSATCVPSA